jgi:hypothetical protein
MALPNKVDYEIYAGDTFEDVISYTGSRDLTGATALSQVRLYTNATTVLLEVTPTVDEIQNEITLTMTASETGNLITYSSSCQEVVYDIQVTFTGSEVETIQRGSYKVTTDVTRT